MVLFISAIGGPEPFVLRTTAGEPESRDDYQQPNRDPGDVCTHGFSLSDSTGYPRSGHRTYSIFDHVAVPSTDLSHA